MKHNRETQVELTAPSAWASYLFNGDASGMSEDDLVACDSWRAARFVGEAIFCTDARFMWLHDAYDYMPLGADCQVYTFWTLEG